MWDGEARTGWTYAGVAARYYLPLVVEARAAEDLRAVFYRREAFDVDGLEAKGPAPYVELEFRHGCVVGRAFGRLIRSQRCAGDRGRVSPVFACSLHNHSGPLNDAGTYHILIVRLDGVRGTYLATLTLGIEVSLMCCSSTLAHLITKRHLHLRDGLFSAKLRHVSSAWQGPETCLSLGAHPELGFDAWRLAPLKPLDRYGIDALRA